MSCISRLKLLGFRRKKFSPSSSLFSICGQFTLTFISGLGCRLAGQKVKSRFTSTQWDIILLSHTSHWDQSLKIHIFFFLFFLFSLSLHSSRNLYTQTSLQAPERIKPLFQGARPSFHGISLIHSSSMSRAVWFLHTWGPGGDVSK